MTTVAIVGGGLVGSMLAMYMGEHGYDVDVYEKRGDIRRDALSTGRSINLAISERGWKALRGVELEDAVRSISIPMFGRGLHSDSNYQLQRYGPNHEAICSVSRGELNKRLVESADGYTNVNFHFNHELLSYREADNSLIFRKDKNIDFRYADLYFGCDGAGSNLRKSLELASKVENSNREFSHNYKELHVPSADGEYALDKGALHIWSHGEVMLIALPNNDATFTGTLFMPKAGEFTFETITEANVEEFFRSNFLTALNVMPTWLKILKEMKFLIWKL